MAQDEMQVEARAQAGWLFDRGRNPGFRDVLSMVHESMGDPLWAPRFAAMIVSRLWVLWNPESEEARRS